MELTRPFLDRGVMVKEAMKRLEMKAALLEDGFSEELPKLQGVLLELRKFQLTVNRHISDNQRAVMTGIFFLGQSHLLLKQVRKHAQSRSNLQLVCIDT